MYLQLMSDMSCSELLFRLLFCMHVLQIYALFPPQALLPYMYSHCLLFWVTLTNDFFAVSYQYTTYPSLCSAYLIPCKFHTVYIRCGFEACNNRKICICSYCRICFAQNFFSVYCFVCTYCKFMLCSLCKLCYCICIYIACCFGYPDK